MNVSALSIGLGVMMLGCTRPTVNLDAERAALLRTIDAENADLIAADTAALRAELPEGDTVYNVTGGQIFRTTHTNALEGYDFAKVRYTAATILDSRIVHQSPDGRMAWIATRYRFTYTRKNAAGAEHQGELIVAALAQTFPPEDH